MIQEQEEPHSLQISSIDELNFSRKLGNGKTAEVRKCYDENSYVYATKIYKEYNSWQSDQNNEITALVQLRHPNIIKLFFSQGRFVVLEYCQNGEMFDFVTGADHFPESIARFYFRQLLAAVDCCHQQGFVHRDIKLENMLLDADFSLKLADFAFAVKAEKDEKLKRIVGTEGYMAPELVQGQEYCGRAIDIFACGVVLFCMVVGAPPYVKQAWKLDPYYQFIMQNKHNKYWQLVEMQQKRVFSREFKDLINQMLAANPEQRYSLEEIKMHPWVMQQGDTPTQEEVREYMVNLQKKMDKNNNGSSK